MVAVMVFGLLFFSKQYALHQWAASALLICGVALCVVSNAESEEMRFSAFGCILMVFSLFGDALYPHCQVGVRVGIQVRVRVRNAMFGNPENQDLQTLCTNPKPNP